MKVKKKMPCLMQNILSYVKRTSTYTEEQEQEMLGQSKKQWPVDKKNKKERPSMGERICT